MANRLIKVGNSFNVPQKYYVCDKLADMGTLGNFGDIVLCFYDHATYMKNSEGEWKEVSLGGGGGGGTTIVQAEGTPIMVSDTAPENTEALWLDTSGETNVFKKYDDATNEWAIALEGGNGETAPVSGAVEALSTEEMMEIFANTGLTETAGVEYTEYTEDPNGEYVYDEELGEYRLAEANEEGTRYSTDSGYLGYEEDGVTYILTY